jgi:hypothetical protein
MREYHNRADLNITVSSIMQKELKARRFERVELWPPAVDSGLFDSTASCPQMRSRLTNGFPEKKLLLTVSRLAPEKNVVFLARMLERLPGVCLAIVGDGPQRQELEERFAGLNANFIGYLKGRDLAAAYASADAFVYASETETMGNVVLEAMACGCAVVVPRAGGIPSLVMDGETGLLFTPGNIEEAVNCTRSLLGDSILRQNIGRAAQGCVEGWSWANSVEAVRGLYERAIVEAERAPDRRRHSKWLAKAMVSFLVGGFRFLAGRQSKCESLLAAQCTAAELQSPLVADENQAAAISRALESNHPSSRAHSGLSSLRSKSTRKMLPSGKSGRDD